MKILRNSSAGSGYQTVFKTLIFLEGELADLLREKGRIKF